MATFTIDSDNNITAFANSELAEVDGNGVPAFDSQPALAKLSAEWPLGRLVEIWNGIPGQAPVKKFADRKRATTRIWTAIQTLAPAAPSVPSSKSVRTNPKAGKAVKTAKSARKSTKTANVKKSASKDSPGNGDRSNKKAEVLGMMQRPGGATRGDHDPHRLAGSHGSRLHQYSRLEGRPQDRIFEECRRRAVLPKLLTICPATSQSRSGHSGAVFSVVSPETGSNMRHSKSLSRRFTSASQMAA